MSQVSIWFERKFEFSFPVELHPNLCARLRGTPARLEEILRGRSHEKLTMKPQGKWSAQEHAGHLLDLESLWIARVDDYVAGTEQLTAADLKNRKTDEANHNARPLEQILADFRAARGKLAEAGGRMDASLFSRTDSASASENADAAGGSSVFRCRTRRSPSGANLGAVAARGSECGARSGHATAISGLVAGHDLADLHRGHSAALRLASAAHCRPMRPRSAGLPRSGDRTAAPAHRRERLRHSPPGTRRSRDCC